MEESEKMTALKKAYAEIILNTAKEAAARIMVSERRVHQVHHDLSSTKDEALRLLLRLKQNMDSQLNEAEMKSLHQQRRIEELEAQLQEAEDIVSNLRAELNEAHTKIEEMEKNQMHNWPNMMENAAYEKGIGDNVLASEVKGLSNATIGDCIATDYLKENNYVGVPDVPSGIVRSKKTEVCINGCTQRVHAYEGNLLNGHLPLAGELDDIKDEKILRVDQEGEKTCINPLVGADVTHIAGKELANVKEGKTVDITSCKGQVPKRVRKIRKFVLRHKRSSNSLHKSLPFVAKEGRSDLPNSQACLPDSHDMPESLNGEHKGTKSVSPSTVPLNVSEMGALSKHVAGVQGNGEVAEAHTNAMDEEGEKTCINPLVGADVTHIVGKELVNLNEGKTVDITSCKGQVPKTVRKKRKFVLRRKRTSASLHKSLPFVAKEGRSDLPNSQTCLPDSHDMPESLNGEHKGKKSVSPSTVPLNVSKMGALSEHVAGVQGNGEGSEAHTNAMDEDREVASSLVLIRQQSGAGDCSNVPNSNPEIEVKNVSSTDLDVKVQNPGEGFPNPRPRDRVLKYTFVRKRKKEALSSDDSSLLPQENPVKRKMVKKQNCSLEQPKSTTGTESSRDSRRMAQVARQLISLSEKKWWK